MCLLFVWLEFDVKCTKIYLFFSLDTIHNVWHVYICTHIYAHLINSELLRQVEVIWRVHMCSVALLRPISKPQTYIHEHAWTKKKSPIIKKKKKQRRLLKDKKSECYNLKAFFSDFPLEYTQKFLYAILKLAKWKRHIVNYIEWVCMNEWKRAFRIWLNTLYISMCVCMKLFLLYLWYLIFIQFANIFSLFGYVTFLSSMLDSFIVLFLFAATDIQE